ncbi:hypothetical protein [Plectonema radiosum]|uniref:hypothetical protein n=1 Tax=Plectonema radiosum TaxID=945768 RepID=UPI001D15613A|nr:hypothetical protein [Plectonema radiosum]
MSVQLNKEINYNQVPVEDLSLWEQSIIRQGVTLENRYLDRPYDAPKLAKRVNVAASAFLAMSRSKTERILVRMLLFYKMSPQEQPQWLYLPKLLILLTLVPYLKIWILMEKDSVHQQII